MHLGFFFYDTHISSSTQLSETAPVCYAVPPLLQALTGIVRFCLNHWCAVELFWQSLNTELAVCITKQIFLQQRVLKERDLASCRINSHLSQERLRIPVQKMFLEEMQQERTCSLPTRQPWDSVIIPLLIVLCTAIRTCSVFFFF